MPIALRDDEENGYLPVFVCDFCGLQVDEVRQGVIGWPLRGGRKQDRTDFYIAHRGQQCDQTLSATQGGTCWMELEEFAQSLRDSLK